MAKVKMFESELAIASKSACQDFVNIMDIAKELGTRHEFYDFEAKKYYRIDVVIKSIKGRSKRNLAA